MQTHSNINFSPRVSTITTTASGTVGVRLLYSVVYTCYSYFVDSSCIDSFENALKLWIFYNRSQRDIGLENSQSQMSRTTEAFRRIEKAANLNSYRKNSVTSAA